MNGSAPSEAHPACGGDPGEAGGPQPAAGLQELAEFYSHAACGHHSLDEHGTILLMNDTELRWLGYSRDEVVGRLRFRDLCTEESRAVFDVNFGLFKAGGRKHNVEYDLVRKDGSILPVLLSATPVLDSGGRYVRSRATVFDLTERRLVERKLRATLDEVEDLYENSPCGYHSIDAAGLFVRMNRTEQGWLGYEPEEVVGRLHVQDLLTPEGFRTFQGMFPLVLESGRVEGLELEFRRKDGTLLPLLINATAVLDRDGRFLMSRSTTVDLTARRQMEKGLHERDQFIRRIADATPDFIFVYEIARNRLVYGNRELSRVLGMTEDEIALLGEDLFAKLLHPDDLALRLTRRESYQSASDEDVSTFEYRLRHADGTWRWMHSRNLVFERGPDGRPTHILGIAQDVTRRKEAEEALARSEALYRTLVQTVPVGIARTDRTGRVSFASAACCRLLGADDESRVIGTRIGDWLDPESGPPPGERRRFVRTPSRPCELKLRRLDGTSFWAEIVTEPLPTERRRFDGEIVAVQDVTERRTRAERVRRDSDRLTFLSRRIVEVQEEERRHLARELHDEIGQTLTAILYRLEAMTLPSPQDPPALLADTIAIADEAIRKIRDLSLALRPVQLDEYGLAATLHSYVDRLALRNGHEVELSIGPETAEFPAEVRTACFRVVQEALTNVVRHAKARSLAIVVRREGESAALTVRDDGKGFDVAEARLRAAAGRSVGLFSMEERVELLGGRLAILSEPGRGTEISARLPLDRGRTEETP